MAKQGKQAPGKRRTLGGGRKRVLVKDEPVDIEDARNLAELGEFCEKTAERLSEDETKEPVRPRRRANR